MLTLTAIMSVLPAGCTAFKTFEILYKQSNQNVRPPINQPADNKIVDAYRELTHMTRLGLGCSTCTHVRIQHIRFHYYKSKWKLKS
jgi:hypothetical protein